MSSTSSVSVKAAPPSPRQPASLGHTGLEELQLLPASVPVAEKGAAVTSANGAGLRDSTAWLESPTSVCCLPFDDPPSKILHSPTIRPRVFGTILLTGFATLTVLAGFTDSTLTQLQLAQKRGIVQPHDFDLLHPNASYRFVPVDYLPSSVEPVRFESLNEEPVLTTDDNIADSDASKLEGLAAMTDVSGDLVVENDDLRANVGRDTSTEEMTLAETLDAVELAVGSDSNLVPEESQEQDSSSREELVPEALDVDDSEIAAAAAAVMYRYEK